MIELLRNELKFRFPGVHEEAGCSIDFQRTLRIPDDNNEYCLPPGLGRFPVEHVDDYVDKLPEAWHQHGGVFVPMYQSEALWINFSGQYPCALKIAAGKVNAVSGEEWKTGLSGEPQDYVVIPQQPWLDGFNVAEGYIRQFVAMPLGEGFTAEEQIMGKAEHGGLQIITYPMKREVYKRLFKNRPTVYESFDMAPTCASMDIESLSMGLAPGGLMRQEIYDDKYGIDVWDKDNGLRCFVHLANSEVHHSITGHAPPHKPPTAKDYTEAGLPWFDYYADDKHIAGSKVLSGLASVGAKTISMGKGVLPDNDTVHPKLIKQVGKTKVVREGEF